MLAGWSCDAKGHEFAAELAALGGRSLVFDPHLRVLATKRTMGPSCPREGLDALEELRPQKEIVWCREIHEDGRC